MNRLPGRMDKGVVALPKDGVNVGRGRRSGRAGAAVRLHGFTITGRTFRFRATMSRLKNYMRGLASGYALLAVNVFYTLASIRLAWSHLPEEEFGVWTISVMAAGYFAFDAEGRGGLSGDGQGFIGASLLGRGGDPGFDVHPKALCLESAPTPEFPPTDVCPAAAQFWLSRNSGGWR